MTADESLSASVSRYRERRAALERSSRSGRKGGRSRAAYEFDRRTATTLRIWRQKSRAAVLARNRSARLLVGWRRRRQVSLRFGWWAMQIGRRADLRERLAVLLCRRIRSTLAAALAQWQYGAVASRRIKESELQRWREWAHVESYQRRRVASGVRHLLHRMRTRYLRASFEAWFTRGQRNRRLGSLLAMSLGAQPVDLQRDAFRDWRCSMRWTCRSVWREDPAAQRQQKAFELAADRLKGRLSKLRAFSVWATLLRRRDREDRLSAMQRLAVARMNFRGMLSLADCLRRWQRIAARRRRSRGLLSNCLVRMQHSLLSYAMNGWHDSVQSSNERKSIGTRAVARMLNARMSRAFGQWRDTTRLVKTRRGIGQRALKRLQNTFLFTALSVWHDAVAHQKARRDVAHRAVNRLRNLFLFGCLNSWRHKTTWMKQRRVIASRAIAKMRQCTLASVLFAWQRHAAVHRASAAIAARAIVKLKHNTLAAALNGLRNIVRRLKMHRKICTRALQRLFHVMLSSAFFGWQESAAEKRRKWTVIQRAVQRLTQRMIASALNGWLSSVYKQRKLRHSVRAVTARMTNKTLARAFNSWLQSAETYRRTRAIGHRTVQRLRNRGVARAFERWQIAIVETRNHRKLYRLVLNRVRQRCTIIAFEHWADVVAAKAYTAAEQARATSTVDATILDSVVKEYDAAKIEWERRWEKMSGELNDAKSTVRILRQQLEQTRARSTVAVKQASMRRAEEVAAEQEKHERALEVERQKNSQLADCIVALRAEMERITSESATRVYMQSVCEDTLVQLMDGNERLRREKLALESTIMPKHISVGHQKGRATASTSIADADKYETENPHRAAQLIADKEHDAL